MKKEVSVNELAGIVQKGFNDIDGKFNAIDGRFDELAGMVKRGFDGVDKRFDGVGERIDGLEKRFDDLSLEMNERFDRLEKIIFHEYKGRIEKLEDQVRELQSDFRQLIGFKK